MVKTDYEGLIRRLSCAYDKRGRVHHDEFLASLSGEIGEFPHRVLKEVVLDGYLEKRGANRLFGSFPEEDIRSLTLKCNKLETESSTALQ